MNPKANPKTVVKKKVAVSPLIPLCNALSSAISLKLRRGKNSWAMSAALIGCRTAINELVQALYAR